MKHFLSTISIFLILLSSCSDPAGNGKNMPSDTRNRILPAQSGRSGELLIVLNEEQWKGELGRTVKEIFAAELPGIGQPEPYFELIQVPNKAFKKIFKTHRNILLIELEDTAVVRLKSNVWAEDQELAYVSGTSYEEIRNILLNNGKEIRTHIRDKEIVRIQKAFRKVENKNIASELKSKGVNMTVPSDFFTAFSNERFFWLRREISSGTQGILFAEIPFESDEQMTVSGLLILRDSLGRSHVSGSVDGSYMETELRYLPEVNNFEMNGMYAVSIQGLWRMEGDFMGGPFYMLAILDEENERILIADAFTYAPKVEKAIYMLQLEAIVKSLKLN